MFKIFYRLSWFYRKYWGHYLLAFLLGIGVSFFLLVAPEVMARVLNGINNNSLETNELLWLIVANVIAVFLIYLTAAWRRVMISRMSARLGFQLRQQYLQKILTMDTRFFHRFTSGDLLTRSQGDIDMVVHTAIDMVLTFLMQMIGLSLLLFNLYRIQPQLLLQILIPLPLLWITLYIMTPILTKNWIRVRQEMANMTESALESVKNVKIVRSFNMENHDYRKNKERVNAVYGMEKRTLRINAMYHPMFDAIATGVVLLSLWLGGQYVLSGDFEIGSLLQFHVYAASLMWPFVDLGHIFSTLNQSNASLDRLIEVWDAIPEINNTHATTTITSIQHIEFKNFTFKYPEDSKNALSSLSFSINQGMTIGIVGKTGSGKSTLLRQILRLYPTSRGSLRINGVDLMNIEPTSYRSLIGYVPQEHALFSLTIGENIALGTNGEVTAAQLESAIIAADFYKDIKQLAQGLDTELGENGLTLSGGQRQRLSIARALINDPQLLILDDSFSAVDGTTEANIIRSLKRLRDRKTTIIVTHRLSAVQHADQILVLDNGAIIDRGTHDELMQRRGYYSEQYAQQQLLGEHHE